MSKIAQNFKLRITLSFIICAALLLLPGVSLLKSEASQGQSAGRLPRPQPGKPEGSWPDLEKVKSKSNVEREPPASIPSVMRSKRNEGKPWDGRRVGDLEPPPRAAEPCGSCREANAPCSCAQSDLSSPPPVPDDQLVQNFFSLDVGPQCVQ